LTTSLAVFASGEGTGFQAIVDHIKLGILRDVDLVLLVHDRPEANVVGRAHTGGVSTMLLSAKGRDEFDRNALKILEEHSIDIVAFAGFLRIVGREFVESYRWRIMNIHPALLPSFGGKGMYGSKVHRTVLESGVNVTGCTVHYVDYAVDAGPIILQSAVKVKHSDIQTFRIDPEAAVSTLADRVAVYEHRLYPKALQLYADRRLKLERIPEQDMPLVHADLSGGWEEDWNRRQSGYIEYQKKSWTEEGKPLEVLL